MSNWKLTVGMEIHVELETKTKMFCGCPNDPFGSEPNTNVCPVCYGLPGALPLLNKEAVAMVVRLGQAVKSEVATETFWARKNYFYPDLPKGYQISQSTHPLVIGGTITIDGTEYHLDHAHLEEDAAKLTHSKSKKLVNYSDEARSDRAESEYETNDRSFVDYNRAGVPLLEIVTKPDFHTAAATKQFCQELQRIIRSLKISSADMEKGQMRCEANISVSQTDELGKKVEVKNINSFRSVEKAIEYEYNRQVKAIEAGEEIREETRTWNDPVGKTVAMRSKETSADYRYFPEPDLPWLAIKLEEAANHTMPDDERRDLVSWGISRDLARTVADKGYFLPLKALYTIYHIRNLEAAMAMATAASMSVTNPGFIELTAENKMAVIELSQKNGWTKETIAEIINRAIAENKTIEALAPEFTHTDDLTGPIQEVLAANPEAVASYKAGKEQIFQFLVGQVMAKTKGRANIQTVRTELEKALK